MNHSSGFTVDVLYCTVGTETTGSTVYRVLQRRCEDLAFLHKLLLLNDLSVLICVSVVLLSPSPHLVDQVEHRQEHRQDHAADHHSQEDDQEWFDQ